MTQETSLGGGIGTSLTTILFLFFFPSAVFSMTSNLDRAPIHSGYKVITEGLVEVKRSRRLLGPANILDK